MSRLLIRLPNWLGDAVMASAIVARSRCPGERPAVLVLRPWLLPLAEAWGDGLDFRPDLAEAERRPREWCTAARAARSAGVGRALILSESWRSVAWARAARLRPVVSFPGTGRALLGASTISRPVGHLSVQYAALADAAGMPPLALGPTFVIPESWRAAGRRLLGAGAHQPFVVLAPGATYGSAKQWPTASFRAVASELVRGGVRVVVVGTLAERDAAGALCDAVGAGSVNIAGGTDLRALGGICALARAVVGNDSGVVHLAAAAGTPTVAAYGSTAPEWTAPLAPRHRSLTTPMNCAPCFQPTCRFGAPCLANIRAEDMVRHVWEACATHPSDSPPSAVLSCPPWSRE